MKKKEKEQNIEKRVSASHKGLPVVLTVSIVWILLALFCFLKPEQAVSFQERRLLNQFPELTLSGIRSGAFMEKYEKAAADQFPFRETFRSLRAVSDRYMFRKKDIHGIYYAEGYLAELLYPLDEDSVAYAGERTRQVYDTYMKETNVKVYLAVVPDKGYYLGEDNGYPVTDLSRMKEIMQEALPEARLISLEDTLSLSSYYRTDSHWRQEMLGESADRVLEAMNAESFTDLEKQEATGSFRGVYAGQAALSVEPEPIFFLTNDVLKDCKVYDMQGNPDITSVSPVGIYQPEALTGRDPYEYYLSGNAAVLIIENPAGDPERELVVFRDSFGSSLIPLLLRSYGRVTVIDTRYVKPKALGDYVQFQDQDVLFIYSSLLLNKSDSLQ